MEGVSLVNAESKQERPQDKERTLLDRFREGPAGALARGFALMTALALSEGCERKADPINDETLEMVENGSSLSELQKNLPHREVLTFLDRFNVEGRRPPSLIGHGNPLRDQAYVLLALFEEAAEKLQPSDEQSVRLIDAERAREARAAYAALETERFDMADYQEWLAANSQYNEKYGDVEGLVWRTARENREIFEELVENLDRETYGYYDENSDGVLAREEYEKATYRRLMGTGTGTLAMLRANLESAD